MPDPSSAASTIAAVRASPASGGPCRFDNFPSCVGLIIAQVRATVSRTTHSMPEWRCHSSVEAYAELAWRPVRTVSQPELWASAGPHRCSAGR